MDENLPKNCWSKFECHNSNPLMSVHILIQEVDGDNADSTEACPYCEGTQEGATHEVIFLLAP